MVFIPFLPLLPWLPLRKTCGGSPVQGRQEAADTSLLRHFCSLPQELHLTFLACEDEVSHTKSMVISRIPEISRGSHVGLRDFYGPEQALPAPEIPHTSLPHKLQNPKDLCGRCMPVCEVPKIYGQKPRLPRGRTPWNLYAKQSTVGSILRMREMAPGTEPRPRMPGRSDPVCMPYIKFYRSKIKILY